MRRIIQALLATIFVCGSPAFAEEPNFLSPDKWPSTVEATVADLISTLSKEEKAEIRKLKKESLIELHFGFGTYIRNNYGLWRGNEALIKSACGKPCHPDDASGFIIERLWETLQKQG
jgi:hypothetical protein